MFVFHCTVQNMNSVHSSWYNQVLCQSSTYSMCTGSFACSDSHACKWYYNVLSLTVNIFWALHFHLFVYLNISWWLSHVICMIVLLRGTFFNNEQKIWVVRLIWIVSSPLPFLGDRTRKKLLRHIIYTKDFPFIYVFNTFYADLHFVDSLCQVLH